jgi:pilus assembly protein CpaB
MRLNSFMMFVLAILFGGAAVVIANVWLSNQNQPQITTSPAVVEEKSTIVVAAKDFSFGDPLQTETLREISWPKASLPEGAFAKVADLTASGRRVALTSISTNEPILTWKISGAGGRASLAAAVTEGMRAVAVRVNDVVGVGGFVLPGDRVDLIYIRTQVKQDSESRSTDVLIQNARVMAVDQSADEKNDKPVLAKVVTVEVSTLDAQKLALAQETGSISLSLRASGSLDQAEPQRVVEEELVSSPSVYMAKLDERDLAQKRLEASLSAKEAALVAKIASVEEKLSASDSSKEALSAKLLEIEKRLQGDIANAGQDSAALRKKYADLEAAIKASSGQTNEELRKRLAEFEASLRDLNSSTPEPEPVNVVEAIEVEPIKTTVTVGVTRGTKREPVEVPQDAQ